jgi:hypothetical protein
MVPLHPIRRVTVYASAGLEETLLARFRALGARGYTLVEARGVGTHPTAEDPFAKSSHVRIELMVNHELGDRIMEFLQGLHTHRQPVTACIEDVEVADPEHY